MDGYLKVWTCKDDKYGLISEFVTENDEIKFAYTRVFNNKYTYMLVSDEINKELILKYLKHYE